MEAYRNQPNLIREQFNQEEDAKLGGYARRQLYELVQNGSDGLAGRRAGRICIWLTPSNLYCGDEGQAINEDGEKALMFSHLSPKRGTDEIGRFGLGFKSVLGVSDEPEFFSRSGSFRFSRARATSRIQTIVPEAKYCPVLRLPEAFEPRSEAEADHLLSSLMSWANNIVRLPLKPGAFEELSLQIRNFPSEFLLFVQHVSRFDLHIGELECREIAKRRLSQQIILSDGKDESRWMLSSKRHLLSKMARSDSRNLDNATEVSISWAASFDRLNQPGRFWAYFPTLTSSLPSGILNAPWKTNEDRQNLLPGIYNDELVDAAAAMVARELRNLSTPDDPASHLDALPRRGEAGDTDYSGRLREQLHRNLQDYEILPDQTGTLRKLTEISYPPRELTSRGQAAEESLARWASQEIRPLRWLHHKALNRTRMAVIERLWDSESKNTEFPRATIATWLEALLKNASTNSEELTASMVAVQTAFLIPKDLREQTHLGNIVLLANGQCVSPNPETVFLSGKQDSNSEFLVHPHLETDQDTLNALEGLGIGPVTPETDFKELTSRILTHVPFSQLFRTKNEEEVDHEDWMEFWHCSRNVKPSSAEKIIRDAFTAWKGSLYVKTVGGHWRTLYCALLPGPIVPGDGSRDEDVTIDVDFHAKDLPLLRQLGAVEVPVEGNELSPRMMWFTEIKARHLFTKRELDRNPRLDKLNFVASLTSGPLDVLEFLSEEGRAQFTWHLLGLPATFQSWTMRHDTQNIYPPWETDSPALTALETHGRIRTHSRIQDLSYGLGDSPRDPEVLSELLSHPRSNLIREAFDLLPDIDSSWESFGDDAPIPLFDVWPGLRNLFPDKVGFLQLIRCDGIRNSMGYVDSYEPECISADDFIYLARMENEEEEIRTIIDVLKIDVGEEKVQELLLRLPSQDIQKERDLVRDCPNDEERLLAAVGEEELRRHLPPTLLAILETDQEQLSGITLAKCAISTFHTGALREYRHVLTHLGPPFRWAGSLRAKEFVTALGFNEAWAGDSNPRRPPFLEVDGPFSLPKLHDFQRKIVGNVRRLIRSQEVTTGRRGMISMPTGSGKTRVAVQAIVESIRDDGFEGGILWVADRDELYEQAVEAWRQVWSSKGAQSRSLRISRMWAGQPQPAPTAEMHVVVASVQTLYAKLTKQIAEYRFLATFKLLVFDEAHRSTARTSTSVMEELGLTRWRRKGEPTLLGLTATPYRGHDELETERLVNRYGKNRLDSGAFDNEEPEAVIQELQDMRVLARAEHGIIEGGEFRLTEEELRQASENPWLPRSVEDRIANDRSRTERILQSYEEEVDADWPTLLFATSVEHSQTIAALLDLKGVNARAVSANTETTVRRRIVEEFRNGQIKVLVNYGIFREGFDAPKTRAIVVARPVYSPNLYFQMIGRGLRGIKNGGNDRCLILDVRDNIDNFQGKLAFSGLDWLWD